VRHIESSFSIPFDLVSRVRQQRDIARAFDCLGKHALMYGAVSGNTPGQNLAAFRDKISQEPGVFEINDVYLLNAETADSAAAKAPATPTTTWRGTASIKVIVSAVVTPTAISVFIIC
jgi:hypothetical protein